MAVWSFSTLGWRGLPGTNKHSTLLGPFVVYKQIKCCDIGPRSKVVYCSFRLVCCQHWRVDHKRNGFKYDGQMQ
jgi:hypothetical protein